MGDHLWQLTDEVTENVTNILGVVNMVQHEDTQLFMVENTAPIGQPATRKRKSVEGSSAQISKRSKAGNDEGEVKEGEKEEEEYSTASTTAHIFNISSVREEEDRDVWDGQGQGADQEGDEAAEGNIRESEEERNWEEVDKEGGDGSEGCQEEENDKDEVHYPDSYWPRLMLHPLEAFPFLPGGQARLEAQKMTIMKRKLEQLTEEKRGLKTLIEKLLDQDKMKDDQLDKLKEGRIKREQEMLGHLKVKGDELDSLKEEAAKKEQEVKQRLDIMEEELNKNKGKVSGLQEEINILRSVIKLASNKLSKS